MRVIGLSGAVVLLAVGVVHAEPISLHAPPRCLETLPLPSDIADLRTRAIALQAITLERFAALDADARQRLPGANGDGANEPGTYDAYRSAILALPAVASRRLAFEQAGGYVANRLPAAAAAAYWQCVNPGTLTVAPAEPVVDDGNVTLRIRWSNLPVERPTTLKWAGVNIEAVTAPPSSVTGSGEATVEFARVPGQSMTLVAELWIPDGPVRARFADPMPAVRTTGLASTPSHSTIPDEANSDVSH